jgi:hypothetical protein
LYQGTAEEAAEKAGLLALLASLSMVPCAAFAFHVFFLALPDHFCRHFSLATAALESVDHADQIVRRSK